MKSEAPFFTVVIPTFNREKELRTSVASVLRQKFQNWELLIIDDGSTDKTEDLIDCYEKQDSRICYIKRPDNRKKGPSTCRNIGIEKANGTYVAFLDSDDEWDSEKLHSDFLFITKHKNVKALYSGVLIDNGKSRYKAPTREVMKGETYEDLVFSGENFAQTSTLIVETKVLKEICFDESIFQHDDMDFYIKIGKVFGWHFYDKELTIVHWERSKTINDFRSMIIFYKRHKPAVVNFNNLARYLTWAWVCAARFDSTFKKFYLNELKEVFWKVGMKYKVFIIFPDLIFFIWRSFKKQYSI